MATKHLARTVIEGGRARVNKFDRRYSNRAVRRKVRQYTHDVRFDYELGEGTSVPTRTHVWRCHDDKLSAAERWLASFAGEPWSEVFGEMFRRFDVRTIAGQHIVYDHLLPSVLVSGIKQWGYDFYVDDQGIMRPMSELARSSRQGGKRARKPWRSPTQVHAWSQDRKVGLRGDTWFWYEPTGFRWTLCGRVWCWRRHRQDNNGNRRRHLEPNGHYRQAQRLSPDEVAWWEQLRDDVQAELRFGS